MDTEDTDARTVRFPPGMLAKIDGTLSYGESRNAWIVAACNRQLQSLEAPVELPPPPPAVKPIPARPKLSPTAGPPRAPARASVEGQGAVTPRIGRTEVEPIVKGKGR